MRFHFHRLFTWQRTIRRRGKLSVPLITGLIENFRVFLPLWTRTKLRRWLSTGDAVGYVVLTADLTPATNISICWSLNLSYADTFVHPKPSTELVDHAENGFRVNKIIHLLKFESAFRFNHFPATLGKDGPIQLHLGNWNPIDWCDTTLCQNQMTPKRSINQCPMNICRTTVGHLRTIRKYDKGRVTNSIFWFQVSTELVIFHVEHLGKEISPFQT